MSNSYTVKAFDGSISIRAEGQKVAFEPFINPRGLQKLESALSNKTKNVSDKQDAVSQEEIEAIEETAEEQNVQNKKSVNLKPPLNEPVAVNSIILQEIISIIHGDQERFSIGGGPKQLSIFRTPKKNIMFTFKKYNTEYLENGDKKSILTNMTVLTVPRFNLHSLTDAISRVARELNAFVIRSGKASVSRIQDTVVFRNDVKEVFLDKNESVELKKFLNNYYLFGTPMPKIKNGFEIESNGLLRVKQVIVPKDIIKHMYYLILPLE